MSVFVVSYDLRTPGRDYSSLYMALDNYERCSPLESVWLLDTNENAAQIRDYLGQYIDSDDGLLVTKLSGNWAARGLNNKCASWLKARFP